MEENKEKNNKKKVIILTVLLLLSVTVVGGVGIYNLLSRATETNPYMEVKSGDENVTGTDYVKFDAYYLKDIDGDGYAEKLRGTAREVGTQDTLYMDLNVLQMEH